MPASNLAGFSAAARRMRATLARRRRAAFHNVAAGTAGLVGCNSLLGSPSPLLLLLESWLQELKNLGRDFALSDDAALNSMERRELDGAVAVLCCLSRNPTA